MIAYITRLGSNSGVTPDIPSIRILCSSSLWQYCHVMGNTISALIKSFVLLMCNFIWVKTLLKRVEGGIKADAIVSYSKIQAYTIDKVLFLFAAHPGIFTSDHGLQIKTWMGRKSADKDGLLLRPFHYRSGAELGSSDEKGWEKGVRKCST